MKTYRFFLAGLGNIGRNLLEIFSTRAQLLQSRYGVEMRAVALSDSTGTLIDPDGISLDAVIAAKSAKKGLRELRGARSDMSALDVLRSGIEIDILFDATPVNLQHGDPGLSLTRDALMRGIHVVTANKGPLALAYQELAKLSDLSDPAKPALRFSGAVGGAMPTINVGRWDLVGAHISRVEAVLNGTTQVILHMMGQGATYDEALKKAQDSGIAETDPSLDVQGWDAANKLVIIANSVLHQPTTLADVSVTGISSRTADEVRAAQVVGERVSLLATAEWSGDRYKLAVAPTSLSDSHPFARLTHQMAIRYETDLYGAQTLITEEEGPLGSSAAMLRDFIDIHRNK